jgi:hypothetical protein
MILHWWLDPEDTTKFAQGAQMQPITLTARVSGLILNEVVGLTHTLSVLDA